MYLDKLLAYINLTSNSLSPYWFSLTLMRISDGLILVYIDPAQGAFLISFKGIFRYLRKKHTKFLIKKESPWRKL